VTQVSYGLNPFYAHVKIKVKVSWFKKEGKQTDERTDNDRTLSRINAYFC